MSIESRHWNVEQAGIRENRSEMVQIKVVIRFFL